MKEKMMELACILDCIIKIQVFDIFLEYRMDFCSLRIRRSVANNLAFLGMRLKLDDIGRMAVGVIIAVSWLMGAGNPVACAKAGAER